MATTQTRAVFEAFKKAAEGKDERAMLDLYADDATITDFNKRNPPAQPSRVKGRDAIAAMYQQIPKELKHRVIDEVIGDDKMAFAYGCEYPTGQQVYGIHICEIRNGKIAREIIAETWDD